MIDHELTEKERAEIEILARNSPAIAKLFSAYCLTEGNMILKLKHSCLRAIDALCNDVDSVASNSGAEILILNSEDKVFDRIWKMATETDKLGPILELSQDFKPKKRKGGKTKDDTANRVAL